jgi:hypothetical protein
VNCGFPGFRLPVAPLLAGHLFAADPPTAFQKPGTNQVAVAALKRLLFRTLGEACRKTEWPAVAPPLAAPESDL